MKSGSQPGSSMKLGSAIRAMVAAGANRLKLFGKADRIKRINKIPARTLILPVLNQNADEPALFW